MCLVLQIISYYSRIMSSRQTEIIERLQQMKRELAKKERRLQKLKRSAGGSSSAEGNVSGSPRASAESPAIGTPHSAQENLTPQKCVVNEMHHLCQTSEQPCRFDTDGKGQNNDCAQQVNITASHASSTENRKKSTFKTISRLLFSDSSTDTLESSEGFQADTLHAKRKRRQCVSSSPRMTRSCTAIRRVLDWLVAGARTRPAECFTLSDNVQFQALVEQKLECSTTPPKLSDLEIHSSVGRESPKQQVLPEHNSASDNPEPTKLLSRHVVDEDQGTVTNDAQRNHQVHEASDSHSEECSKRKLLGLNHPMMFYRSLKCRFQDPLLEVSISEGNPAVLVGIHSAGISFWSLNGTCWDCLSVDLQHTFEENHCTLRDDSSLYIIHGGATSDISCVQYCIREQSTYQYVLGTKESSQSRRACLLTKLRGTCFAMATRSSRGSTRIKSCQIEGQVIRSIGETSDTLHSLTSIEELPGALLGACQEAIYIWNYTKCVLVRKIIQEPNTFLDISLISWAASHSGLIFYLAHSVDDSQLIALNPFSGKADAISSYTCVPRNGGLS
ncbi:uncharacterized protein LOC135391518 isoform X2 [Ornithodoros turicata]|uniref:uncharacterized protein LOC135391518 isoform X2 n=1 Tax=Ornithodoros turicata TaxID=34597 RepID=UPI0031397645